MSDIRIDDRRRILLSSALALAFWIVVSLAAGFLPWESWMLSKDQASSVLVTLEEEVLPEPEPPPEAVKVESRPRIETKVQPEPVRPKDEVKQVPTETSAETVKPEAARPEAARTESQAQATKAETSSSAFADNPAPKPGQKVEVKSNSGTSGAKKTTNLNPVQGNQGQATAGSESTSKTVSPVEGRQAERTLVKQDTAIPAPNAPENIKKDPGNAPNPRSASNQGNPKAGVLSPRTGGKTDESLLAVKDDTGSPNRTNASGTESKTPGGALPSGTGSKEPQRNASEEVITAANAVKPTYSQGKPGSQSSSGGQPGQPGGNQGTPDQGKPGGSSGAEGSGDAEAPSFGGGAVRGFLGKPTPLPTRISAEFVIGLPPEVTIEVSFIVKDTGIVPRSSISYDIPLPRNLEDLLSGIIARWRFQKGNSDGQAKFLYSIKTLQ